MLSLSTMLIVLLVLVLLVSVGSLPMWSYSDTWSCLPSGGLGMVAITVVVLLIIGGI